MMNATGHYVHINYCYFVQPCITPSSAYSRYEHSEGTSKFRECNVCIEGMFNHMSQYLRGNLEIWGDSTP